jgi:acetyl-CoA C-acetyltransferase
MPEAVIVDSIRTPIGRAFKGSLAGLRPDDTTAYVLDQLLERNPDVSSETVEEVIAGVGMPQGLQAFNVARISVLLSEKLPDSVNGVTVSRYCASSLEAIKQAANNVNAGQGDTFIAAGLEWVSRFNERTEPAGAADQNEKLQGNNGQPNAYIAMGDTAVNVAKKYEVSRSDMDKYAQRSQELAVKSQEDGFFDREIVAVKDAEGNEVVKDDGPRASSTLEKLSQLPEAFEGGGGVTAGNSCPLNDGAAATLVMSREKADELGLKPRAKVVDQTTVGVDPVMMLTGPIPATQLILKRNGMKMDDVDLVEINEAFASVVAAWRRELEPDMDRVNVNGGAIAIGHPLGSTGARLITTLLHELERSDKETGLVTMCCGGGLGTGTLIQRV